MQNNRRSHYAAVYLEFAFPLVSVTYEKNKKCYYLQYKVKVCLKERVRPKDS